MSISGLDWILFLSSDKRKRDCDNHLNLLSI
ncbi:hypothetical protein [Acinetobacter phage Ab69]|nr:hypothetical protein [Acinetobacter phage Ab69]